MSPEQSSTPEQNNEVPPYVRKAQEVIEQAAANAPKTDSRFEVVDSYIADVLEAADAGEITGSNGVYSREQMLFQFKDFLSESKIANDENGINPFTRIPSANGLRDAFRLMMDSDATGNELEQSLQIHLLKAETEQTPELITSEAVRKIGGAELKAAGIQEPMSEVEAAPPVAATLTKEQYLSTLTDGLTDDDIAALEGYAVSKAAQTRAHANGEYDNVAHWKREAYKDYAQLSETAKAIADRYAQVANHYS